MSVKVKKRGRPSGKVTQLTAHRIVLTAKELLENDGKVPSIRKLASRLEVDPMAIYHYFINKAALLEAITASLMEEIVFPHGEEEWTVEVKALCRSYLNLLARHPGLLETMLSMPCGGPAKLFSERLGAALVPLKLNEEAFIQILDLLADYLHGVALAMQCNPGASLVERIDGPIELIFAGLRHQHCV